jgi:hypothetical protein
MTTKNVESNMNLKQIKEVAQSYCDRYDQELVDALPSFIKIVEAKINNALRTGEQAIRSQIYLELDQEYYGLPSDWGGARDIEILEEGQQHGRTLTYLAPEEMNKISRKSNSRNRHNYYTIIANQIQIAPPCDREILEIVYYQRLPELVEEDDTNWLTEKNPDAYVFGLCTEIGAFAKDDVIFMTYDGRFKESLSNVTQEDQITRWSGPAHRVQYDGLVV